MNSGRDKIFAITISLVVLSLVTIPYVIAERSGVGEYFFGGFLLNPVDGNTYLAKMYQGMLGNWRFTLPFTADPGGGAYINLFYLSLGHFARFLELPLKWVFHLARVFGCLFLLWSLWHFFCAIFENPRPRKFAFALASIGSGMGWLLLGVGSFTSDFWVAETYPFLTAYVNPHFPIGLGLVLWLVTPSHNDSPKLGARFLTCIIALVLSLISPFGVVITLVVLGGSTFWLLVTKSPFLEELKQALIVGLSGLPMLVYYLWVVNTDPAFIGWNAQNLTPSPPVWDLVVSLSPALLLGIYGILRSRRSDLVTKFSQTRILLVWVSSCLLLIFLPIGLQRRFMMGLYVPVVGLASIGLEYLTGADTRRYRLMAFCIFLLAVPTNLVILLTAQTGIENRDPIIYLRKDEFEAFSWIEGNTPSDALILAAPETGLFIPTYTGRRVIYGHPFETLNAETEEAFVRSFYDGGMSVPALWEAIADREIDYVYYGPREKKHEINHPFQDWRIMYSNASVYIYSGPHQKLP